MIYVLYDLCFLAGTKKCQNLLVLLDLRGPQNVGNTRYTHTLNMLASCEKEVVVSKRYFYICKSFLTRLYRLFFSFVTSFVCVTHICT